MLRNAAHIRRIIVIQMHGLLAIAGIVDSQTFKADLAEGDVLIAAGSTLQLTCSLRSAEYHANMSFTIRRHGQPDIEVSDRFYERPSNMTLRLVMPNVSTELDGSWFCCMLDSKSAYCSLVTIREFPKEVHPQVIVDSYFNMTLSWCTEQKDVKYLAQYRTSDGSGRFPCRPTYTDSADVKTRCWSCTVDMPSEQPCCVTFIVLGTNVIGSRTSRLTVTNPHQHVKPRPVQSLAVDASRSQVSVSWTTMALSRPISLEYIVECISDNGTNLTRMITCTDVNKLQTELTGLKPFTHYNISVRSRLCKPDSGQYWSDVSTQSFGTSEDAPSAAPYALPGWFRYQCSESVTTSPCPTQLFWQPIPTSQRNGIVLGYEIYDDGLETERMWINGSDVTSATVDVRCCGTRRKMIRAFTAARHYSPLAFFIIPPISRSGRDRVSDISVETTDMQHQVTVHWSLADGSNIDNFTVFYCKGCRSCDEEPQGFIVTGQSRSATVSGIVDPDRWLYSVSGNWKHGSTGLARQWIWCVHRHDALPSAVRLDRTNIMDITSRQATVRWQALGCRDDLKTGRVQSYVLLLTRYNSTDTVYDVTVPSTVTQYTFEKLNPGSSYIVSICTVSSAGRVQSSTQSFQTEKEDLFVVIITVIAIAGTIFSVCFTLLVFR